MDIERFLKQGNVSKNPEYNPKTKKGRNETPLLQDFNVGSSISDRLRSNISSNISKDIYSLDTEQLEKDADKNNVYLNPYDTEEQLNLERAKNQSAFEQIGNSLAQMGLNEVILGTALGFSNLVDMGVNLLKDEGEDDYTNPFSLQLENLQNDIRERFKIYQENPNASWSIEDFGWWADNAVSIMSTASMLVPSTAVTKGASLLGKIGKVNKGISKINKGVYSAVRGTKDIIENGFKGISKEAIKNKYKAAFLGDKAATFDKAARSATEIGGTALLSRTLENYMEARGVYNEVYDDTLNKVKSMSETEKQTLLKNNPQFEDKTDEEIAEYISSVSADKTFRNDYVMLLFDILQFKAISGLWKGLGKKATTAEMRIANRNAIKGLGKEGETVFEKTGWLANRKEAFKDIVKHPFTSIAAIEWSEGIEEGYQGIQTEKGKEVSKKILDPTFNARVIDDYLKDPVIWEQAFWGVLGGVGFQAIGQGIAKGYQKIDNLWNKKHMSEEDYAKASLTENKIRLTEIEGRKAVMDKYINDMKLLAENKNPDGYAIDPVTKSIIEKDGKKVNASITDEEAEILKQQKTRDFVTNMALDATDVGNYELFKEFVQSKEFDKYFEEAGINQTSEDKKLSQLLINRMDKVNDIYNKALHDIFNSVNVENQYVGIKTARLIVNDKLKLEDLYNDINNANKFITENEDNADNTNAYLEHERINYARKILDELDKREINLRQQVNEHKLSQQAFDLYKQDYDFRRKQVLDYIANNTIYGTIEEVKENMKQSIDKRNASSMLAKFDKFIEDNSKFIVPYAEDSTGLPKKTIQDAIKKKIDLELEASYTENIIPKNQTDYKSKYDKVAEVIDRKVIEKFNEATDRVNKWLETQPDLDKAVEDIITNNVPEELKRDLDILKIGHWNTRQYAQSINMAIDSIRKEKNKKAEEAKTVTVDGETVEGSKAEKTKEIAKPVTEAADKSLADETKKEIKEESKDKDDSPSTGVRKKTEVPPEATYTADEIKESIESADKSLASAISSIDKGFQDEINARAIGSSIAIELFHEAPELYNHAINSNIDSDNMTKLIDTISERIEEKEIPANVSKQIAYSSAKQVIISLTRKAKREGASDEKLEHFKELADAMALKAKVTTTSDGMNALTKEIPVEEFNETIEAFIDSYITYKNITAPEGQEYVINIENLFYELLNNKEIGVEEAKYIFYNISDYIRNPFHKKYIFTNLKALNKTLKDASSFFAEVLRNRAITEPLSNYIHIATPSKMPKDYYDLINEIDENTEITVEYGRDRNNRPTQNTLSIRYKDREIGYIGTVNANADNNGFALRNQKEGFVYKLNKLPDGTINSNFDNVFINIIQHTSDHYKDIWKLINKIYRADEKYENIKLTDDEINLILNDNNILSLYSNNQIKFSSHWVVDSGRVGHWEENNITNEERAKRIINAINNIVFYNNEAVNEFDYLLSYNQWKINMYDNYENTFKLERLINPENTNASIGKFGIPIKTKFIGLVNNQLLFTEESRDIKDINLNSEKNHLVAVIPDNDNGFNNIVDEQTGARYSNVAGFTTGNIGFVVRNNPNAPSIAMLTESNRLYDNEELANDVKAEIVDILTKFQSKELTFDEVTNLFANLVSGPKLGSNHLFNGFSVIITKDNNKMLLNIKGKKGKYNLIIHKTMSGSDEEGTGITYIPKGDEKKMKSSIKPNKRFLNDIATEIVNGLTYNKTFYTINNQKTTDEHSNKFMYKEGNKFVVEFNGKKRIYNNFGQFIIENNAFKTTQDVNEQGGYFSIEDKTKSLYIDASDNRTIVSAAEGTTENVADTITSASKTKSNNTKSLLELAKVEEDKIKILTGENEFGISIVPEEYFFDKNKTIANAYASKGKVYLTNGTINAFNKRGPKELIRLLTHENLHVRLAAQNAMKQEGIVDDLIDTYNAFIEVLNEDLNTLDKNSNEYKQAQAIKRDLIDKVLNPKTYFTSGNAEQNRKWAKLDETEEGRQEKKRIFAEEWLVESLSQRALINYLNTKIYKGEDIDIEGIDEEKKTIFQKIIELLLKIFGKTTTNIQKNTILAKQFMIVGDRSINTSTDETIITDENTNESTDENIDEPEPGTTDTNTEEESSDEDTKDELEETEEESIDADYNDSSVTSYMNYDTNDEEFELDESEALTEEIEDIDYSSNELLNNLAEEQAILTNAPRDNQGRLLAPNGKPSNLNEKQYVQVRTDRFKQWFGDWENNPENASKVLDENREPLVVYHGTPQYKKFNVFKSGYFGNKDIARAYAETDEIDENEVTIRGYNVPDDVEYADFESYDEFLEKTQGSIYATFLNIKNPLYSNKDIHILDRTNKNAKERFKELYPNNDGIISEEFKDMDFNQRQSAISKQYVPLNANQIKSATENTGEFSSSDDIRYSNSVSVEEINVESYREDTKVNPHGFNVMISMNDYINMYDIHDRLLIANMIKSGEVKFVCK